MHFITRLVILTFALLLTDTIIPGIEITGLYPAIIAALLLGVLNAIVRPILVILTLPITILTLGVFIFVINAFLFMFVASFVDGFEVANLLTALVGSVLVSIVSSIVHKFL
jgi:putative membrane protein